MSPNAQQIALLTDMGWTDISYGDEPEDGPDMLGHPPGGPSRTTLPDLTLDLMAKAEQWLAIAGITRDGRALDTHETMDVYLYELGEVIRHNHRIDFMVRATKEQRREAYLKTRGLWREEA